MAPRSIRSSRKGWPRARLLSDAGGRSILACGADPASLPYMEPKLSCRNVLLEGVKLYAANILKQSMLSIGGDVAVHRGVISGKVAASDCLVTGDLRHYRLLVEKLRLQPGMECIADSIEQQVFPDSTGLTLKLLGKSCHWDDTPVIMGILNVTPDSFSDGGMWLDPAKAVDHACDMVQAGAGIIDIGGESSRPGARETDAREEISRVVPVIREIASRLNVPISIDTRKSRVAEAAIDAGACIVNDISALSHDRSMIDIIRQTGAGVILMHMKGTPETMQRDTAYSDIVGDIYAYLDEKIEQCLEAGIDPRSILADPGIGFGKDLEGNLQLIRHIGEFASLGVPVVLGHSRKAFVGTVLNTPVNERQEGTDAVSAWGTIRGVHVLRVHDVRRTLHVRNMILAIQRSA
ncbi:MAG TPA: dihydropteroate synthase [Deltaproteobacteria bacterium]|nr:dihydropteroate synthase [Pseudomonadota bacterium]HOD70942.1 dihydropteroate synthase [Deltaproteobacteria bacterium]HRR22239.1 dihydropteroate synthase [Desulfomonilia bacterium]HON61112.1 dihydropteroate synthase [Deltaproteobacteria bacterium]HPX49889.1 dihydropteroate synthase [Deltaproteobacteria bacterium]